MDGSVILDCIALLHLTAEGVEMGGIFLCVCVHACVCAYVGAGVRACVHAWIYGCVRVCVQQVWY